MTTLVMPGIEIDNSGFNTDAASGSIEFQMGGGRTTDVFILNWGYVDLARNTDIAVVFNRAFPNAFVGAITTAQAATSGVRNSTFSNASTTGMRVRFSSNSTETVRVHYLAWGI